MDLESMAEQLEATGKFIDLDFFSRELILEIRADLERIQAEGTFVRAGTGQSGQGKGREVRDQVRRDEIHWLEDAIANPIQKILLGKIEDLKNTLNRTLYLGLSEFEGHYAAYPSGGFYKRHLDCFKEDDARIISLILYLNPDWKSSDGGRLRIYDLDSTHVDVDPVAGTLVGFLSREHEHEVLISHADRYGFAGWFKTQR
ncbi:MAG: 2OG-Fe(II) oxygenase [Methylotenera sp.]|nr:2OG-Fe(II) oxygenase [Oligoflexia bacterium]